MRKDGRWCQPTERVCQVPGAWVGAYARRERERAGGAVCSLASWARTSKGPSAPARQVGTFRVRDADTGHKGTQHEIVWEDSVT